MAAAAADHAGCHEMFIFSNRPFRAVAAGLGVALLTVCLDRACERNTEAAVAPAAVQVAKAPSSACAAPGACGIVRAGS
jgi:hypothetical protein